MIDINDSRGRADSWQLGASDVELTSPTTRLCLRNLFRQRRQRGAGDILA